MVRFAVARVAALIVVIAGWLWVPPAWAQAEKPEKIDSSACASCHETSSRKTKIADDISHSIHDGLACLDCHADRDTVPHAAGGKTFFVGSEGCRTLSRAGVGRLPAHGRAALGTSADMPHCSSCHGSHDVLPSRLQRSRTHPSNLPATCGSCHENLDITSKYDILIDTPVKIYSSSVHGRATKGGVYVAATCSDCHSTGGSAHKILGPGDRDLDHQPLQHPGHLRQVPQGDRGRLQRGDPRAARRPGRDRRAGVHHVPRRARDHLAVRPALAGVARPASPRRPARRATSPRSSTRSTACRPAAWPRSSTPTTGSRARPATPTSPTARRATACTASCRAPIPPRRSTRPTCRRPAASATRASRRGSRPRRSTASPATGLQTGRRRRRREDLHRRSSC